MSKEKNKFQQLEQENREISDALVNATRVIAAQALELVDLKGELSKLKVQLPDLKENIESLVNKNKTLTQEVHSLQVGHIATTKAVRQKAVAYLDENGNVIIIGEEAYTKVSYISGRDRMILNDWKPLGIIPKIDIEDL